MTAKYAQKVRGLLIIPESRKRPITESLLYKQIVRFLYSEDIEDHFDIVFISIADGVVEAIKSDTLIYGRSKVKLPPKNFRSGRSWISKEVKEEMSNSIVEYLKAKKLKSYKLVIAYVRGSYLEAVRLAVKKSGVEIKEIFTEDELTELKSKGIMWMKVGLRMPQAFEIFQKRIIEFIKEDSPPHQLSLW